MREHATNGGGTTRQITALVLQLYEDEGFLLAREELMMPRCGRKRGDYDHERWLW
jgi:hypothetical protein